MPVALFGVRRGSCAALLQLYRLSHSRVARLLIRQRQASGGALGQPQASRTAGPRSAQRGSVTVGVLAPLSPFADMH